MLCPRPDMYKTSHRDGKDKVPQVPAQWRLYIYVYVAVGIVPPRGPKPSQSQLNSGLLVKIHSGTAVEDKRADGQLSTQRGRRHRGIVQGLSPGGTCTARCHKSGS